MKLGSVDAPVSRRERKKEQTRIALSRAALKLFSQRGFNETTVDDIAEAADVHRATFFRTFTSKDEVAFGGITKRLEVARAALRNAAPAADPWSTARHILTEQATGFASIEDELEAAYRGLWTSDPALLARFTSMMLAWEREVAMFFAASWGRNADIDAECRAIASAMIGVTRAAMMAAAHAGGPEVPAALKAGFDLLDAGNLIEAGKRRAARAKRKRR